MPTLDTLINVTIITIIKAVLNTPHLESTIFCKWFFEGLRVLIMCMPVLAKTCTIWAIYTDLSPIWKYDVIIIPVNKYLSEISTS